MLNDNGRGQELTRRTSPPEEEAQAAGMPDPTPEPVKESEPFQEESSRQSRLGQFVARLSKPEASRDAKSGERTRGLVILAGTTLAFLFLFFGLFTTDSGTKRKERSTKPNLGRPETASVNPDVANRSPVPQLSVNQQPSEESGELSETDVLGTMRNRGTPVTAENESIVAPPPPPKNTLEPRRASSSLTSGNPALPETYHRDGPAPLSRRVEMMGGNEALGDDQARQKPAPPAAVNVTDSLRKSSIVFVRTVRETAIGVVPTRVLEREPGGLLSPGTVLVARLQHAVSSAAKVPITAVIEYNYEKNGQLVVPAGTKAYGELSQATPQGWVTIKFHTLELPTGEQETIAGSALCAGTSMARTAARSFSRGRSRVSARSPHMPSAAVVSPAA